MSAKHVAVSQFVETTAEACVMRPETVMTAVGPGVSLKQNLKSFDVASSRASGSSGALGALRLRVGVVEINAPETLKQKPLHRSATELGAAADVNQLDHARAPSSINDRRRRASELLRVVDIEQRLIAENAIDLNLFRRFRGRKEFQGGFHLECLAHLKMVNESQMSTLKVKVRLLLNQILIWGGFVREVTRASIMRARWETR